MGFDVRTFGFILLALPVNGTRQVLHVSMSARNPHPNRYSLHAGGALGLLLHYLDSIMHEISL